MTDEQKIEKAFERGVHGVSYYGKGIFKADEGYKVDSATMDKPRTFPTIAEAARFVRIGK
jgi:hypothetical protein